MVAAAGGTFQIRHGEVVGADDGTQITLHAVQAVRVARAVVVGVPVDDDHALAGDLGRAEPATPVASVAAAAMAASSLFNRFAMVPSVLSSGLPMTGGDYAGKELLPNGRRTA